MKKNITLALVAVVIVLFSGCTAQNQNTNTSTIEININEPATADWETYTDEDGVFTFQYPDTWEINGKYSETTNTLWTGAAKISEIPEVITGMASPNRADVLEEQEKFEIAQSGDDLSIGSSIEEVLTLDNGLKTKLYIGGYEGFVIYYKYTFFTDEYKITMSAGYNPPAIEKSDDFYENLELQNENYKKWRDDIYNGTAETEVQAMFDEFDEIVETIQITN